MDEILFRGKRVDNGEWIFGYFYMPNNDMPLSKWYGQTFIQVRHGDTVEVIPETVGQYMWMKDKNGEKLFKGDIIKTNTESVVALDWSKERMAYVFVTNGVKGGWIHPIDGIGSEFEIIGNVHDNHRN